MRGALRSASAGATVVRDFRLGNRAGSTSSRAEGIAWPACSCALGAPPADAGYSPTASSPGARASPGSRAIAGG